jgi:ComF family protein
MRILTQSAEFIRRARDKLLAQDCLLCGADSAAAILCPACAGDLKRLPKAHCPQCALPTPLGERCGRCLSQPPFYDATVAAFVYEFPVDKLIQSFKYAHRLALGAYFGQQLAAQAKDYAADLATHQPIHRSVPPLISRLIPLPLHPQRLRERGYNQSLELARPISKVCGWPIEARLCSRTRNTPAQAGLPWRERGANVRGAFHCYADLSGQHIALVDDVMTTGASLNECARTLKLHGAAQVTLFVVARALPK